MLQYSIWPSFDRYIKGEALTDKTIAPIINFVQIFGCKFVKLLASVTVVQKTVIYLAFAHHFVQNNLSFTLSFVRYVDVAFAGYR